MDSYLIGTVTLLDTLKLFLIGAWLGAAVFFSAVVAPSAFSVLRAFQLPNAGEIAGTLVTRTLSAVNISGFVISVLLLMTALAFRRRFRQRSDFLEMASAIIVAASTGLGQWMIAARLRALRVAMVMPIDEVALTDPRRVEFNRLHGYSVIALSIAMIAALFAFVVVAYRARLNPKPLND